MTFVRKLCILKWVVSISLFRVVLLLLLLDYTTIFAFVGALEVWGTCSAVEHALIHLSITQSFNDIC